MMRRTRVKFCGMTRAEDVALAVELGVDAIGMVFTRRSPRFVELDRACAIAASVPPFVAVVALFMDDAADWVREVERRLRPQWLQFHGSESDGFCSAFATPHLKAIAMGSCTDIEGALVAHPHARGLLLDGHVAGAPGGSGQGFAWSRIPADTAQRVILAGGLHAGNVATAIRTVRPWAVDVSSGIESAPGVKDAGKMRAFIAAVQAVSA